MARNNDKSGAGQGSAKTALPTASKQSFIDQSAVIVDAISEGEVEGLVDGAHSIYLDGVPVLDATRKETHAPGVSANVTYVASSGTITDNETANMFSGMLTTQGTRYIRIDGAAATGAVNVTANSALVTPSTSGGITFANSHQRDSSTTLVDMQPKIRIAGAGLNGGELVSEVVRYNANNTVEISPPVKTTVNNATARIDLVDKVASISSNTCTISPSGQGINRSNVPAVISSPITNVSDAPIYNFDNVSYAFRTGHRFQRYIRTPEGIGSAAIGFAVGQDLPASSKAALGMGTETRIVANLDGFDSDPLTSSDINDSGVSVAASSFNLNNPGEVDQLKITINHPNGLVNNDDTDGDSGPAWIELKIVFQYQRDGVTYSETVFGVDDLSTITREKQGTRPSPYSNLPNAHSGVIFRKSSSQFATVFSFDTERFQPFEDWTIKILRYTPVNYEISNKNYSNVCQVGFVEAIIEDKLNYPYTALAAIMVDSKDSTSIPTRSYEIRGIKCKVPTNYIPMDSMYAGSRTTAPSYNRNVSSGVLESTYQDWDGKFRGDKKVFTDPNDVNYHPVYTNNPAWILYDLLTNERYGLGTYIDPDYDMENIDKYQFFELAKYCDELVPDGQGGTEPRFSCNVFINQQKEALKVIKDLLTVFRGIMLWHDGEISINLQQEKAPLFTFTKGNVVGGLFSYQYPSSRVRANSIQVTWNDPENHYKQQVEIVEDTENIAKVRKIVSKKTVAYGCTSRSQAHRVGKYHLLTEINDNEIVTFSSGIGGQLLRPGDLIEVQDADKDNIQLSGRVSSGASTTVIPVDRSVALSNTANADLTLIFPKSGAYLAQQEATIDGTLFQQGDLILQAKNQSDSLYNLDSQEDTTNAQDDSGDKIAIAWSEDVRIETKAISSYNASHIVVSSAFSAAPDEEVVYAVTQTTATGEKLAGSPITYIINEIKEQDDKSFTISAIKHTTGKYDEIDRGWKISSIPDVMRPPKSKDGVPVPRSVSLQLLRGRKDETDDEERPNQDEERFANPRIDVYWQAPQSLRLDKDGEAIETPYEHTQYFQIQHNFYTSGTGQESEGLETIVVPADRVSHTFDNVPKRGTFKVRIRTVNSAGNKSPYVQRNIVINPEKPAKTLEPKIRFGGSLTSGMSIASANGLVSLEESTYNFTPAESDLQTYTVTSGSTAQTSQSFASLANGNTAYMMHDFSDTTDPWKAIEYVRDATGASVVRFAKQLGVAAFTQKTGTATVTSGNTIVTGTGTAFASEYEPGDLFIFDDSGSTRFIAPINFISSNTQLEIAYTPTANLSSKNVFAQSLQPNFIKDTIIGEVANTSGTFSLINYASGNKGEAAYSINGSNENHNFAAANNGAVSDFSTFINNYTVKKGTVSYTFANSGTALNTFGLSKSDSNCTSNINTSNGAITVSALTAAIGTITVTITDRYTSETIATRIITLGKTQPGVDGTDGSIGSDAKVVTLTASDNSIIYDSSGANPTPTTSQDITLTATSKNFTDPRMKFTGDGISDDGDFTATGVSSGVKTFTFPVPASINTSPQTVQVEVQEGASGGTVALDTITVISVKPGADGSDGADAITVNLTNEAHTFPASATGVVSSFAGSGTKIEVFKGATLLTPVANTATPGANQYSVTTNSDTNISVGSYTLDTTGTDKGVTIGDHSGVANGTDLSEIEYSINVENSITLTKAQNFNKAKAGVTGGTGNTGPRSATGYIYYQSSSTNSPTSGANVSTSGVSYNFSTSLLSGGEIGTGSTNWNQVQPTFTGSNSNKYWYAYFSVIEDDFGDSTPNISFSIPYLGQNFTGLVTFTGNDLGDGSSIYDPAGVINNGSTTIDGGKITTSSIEANKISVNSLSALSANIGTVTAGVIKSGDHAGTADGSDFSTDGTQINLSDGSISSKNFRIASNGVAEFKGTLAISSITGAGGATASSVTTAQGTASNAAAAASAAQSTADSKTTASAAATAANSQNKTGGSVGGWTLTASTITGGSSVGGSDGNFATGTGIVLGSTGYLSSKNFYIDSSGNAKFKGTLEGDDITVNGTLVLPSDGGSASGATIGGWSTNTMANKRLVEIGSGAGFYQGYVRLVGNTNHVKTVSIQIRTGTSNTSQGSLIYETPQLHQYTAGNLLVDGGTRIYSSSQTANMPIAFTYSGSSALSVYIRAQADTGLDYLGTSEARFLKFGTTDPIFSFASQNGVATSTAFYSNTQVVGGFQGTKTVSISNTSFTRFKIDGGSFGTSNQNISNGSYINVEITSASTTSTTRSSIVTIGDSTDDFSVTTGSGGGGGGGGGGGFGGGCFVEGTPVVMANGSLKNIEDVTAGESVKSFGHSSLSLDENAWKTWTATEIANGSFGTSTVQTVTSAHEYTHYYWVNYNLKVTNEHPMLAFKDNVFKFVEISDLLVGDFLVREDGTLEEVFAKPKVTVNCITHNMDVEDQDTYVVKGGNGVGYIAHNSPAIKE